ncbi:MAG: glycosyltransferase [Dehalococcoidales bacterium]|nr:glycosyltransferase [Dehalococcoidales bacterium]
MKILQVIPYFYPAWSYGGPPRSTYGLCKELVKRGHEVTVFTTDALDRHKRIEKKQEKTEGIEIRRFRNLNNYIAFRHRIFLSSGMMSAMKQDLKNYDIVHLNEFRTLQNLMAHHYALKYRVPYIVQPRGSLVNILAKQRLKRLFDAMGGRRLIQDATRLVALAPLELPQFIGYGVDEGKIDIVPNGIDLEEYRDLPSKGEFREKYGLEAKHRVVLFLGRVHRSKGIDLLIKAFSQLVGEYSEARLAIAGPDDGYLSTLKNLASDLNLKDRVIFTGGLFGVQKLAAYVDADVYTLPSFYESFGISVFEALACGTPVVVTDRCGIANIVKEKGGLAVQYEAASIRDGLRQMLGNEQRRQQYGREGQELVREKYGWGSIAAEMEKVYERCQVK